MCCPDFFIFLLASWKHSSGGMPIAWKLKSNRVSSPSHTVECFTEVMIRHGFLGRTNCAIQVEVDQPMTGGVLTILPILRPSPPVFAPPAAGFKIERVLTAIRGKLLSPPAISVPIEIPMEGFNNFGIVQMGPDFSPVLRQIIITHSLVLRVLRLNHRQLRSLGLSRPLL